MNEFSLPRVLGAAKEFNIGPDTLVDFLVTKGFDRDKLKATTKLTQEMYDALQSRYQGDKVAKNKADLIKGATGEEIAMTKQSILDILKIQLSLTREPGYGREIDEKITEVPESEGPKIITKIDLSALDTSTRSKSIKSSLTFSNRESWSNDGETEGTKKNEEEGHSDGHVFPIIKEIKSEKHEGQKILGKIELPVNKDRRPLSSLEKRTRKRIPVDRHQPGPTSNQQQSDEIEDQSNWGANITTETVQYHYTDKADGNENAINLNKTTKYGRVASFNQSRGFGFINIYRDRKKCFVHVSKMLIPSLSEGDIVSFKTQASAKNPGELDALDVDIQIPLFVFNKTGVEKSFSIILDDSELEREIMLAQGYESGFFTCYVNNDKTYHTIQVLNAAQLIYLDLPILAEFIFERFVAFPAQYQQALVSLFHGLGLRLTEEAYDKFCFNCSQVIRRKPILAVIESLSVFKNSMLITEAFKATTSGLNKLSFGLWYNGSIEALPKPLSQLEVNEWKQDIVQELPGNILQAVVQRLLQQEGLTKQVQATLVYLFSLGWDLSNQEAVNDVADFVEVCKKTIPSFSLPDGCFRTDSFLVHLELFKRGLIEKLSEQYVAKHLDSISSKKEKVHLISSLSTSQAVYFFSKLSDLQDEYHKYLEKLIEHELRDQRLICFDLEVEGNTIREYAWKAGPSIITHHDFTNSGDGLEKLLITLNQSNLIVGQNIKAFDLPILAKMGDVPDASQVWDTLEVEMLINPLRHSYALLTSHTAKDDTSTTFNLFINQIGCLLSTRGLIEEVKNILPNAAVDALQKLSALFDWPALSPQIFQKNSDRFFRPAPTHSAFDAADIEKISNFLGLPGPRLIIAPDIFWKAVANSFDVDFLTEDPHYNFYLDKDELEMAQLETLTKLVLQRFIARCFDLKKKPYLHLLPSAVKLRVPEEVLYKISKSYKTTRKINDIVCVSPKNIETVYVSFLGCNAIKVCVIGEELYEVVGKTAIGQNFDFTMLFDRLKQEPIWLQLSGGKSFVEIEERQCRLLGIETFPKHIRNIWLEKIGRSKFQVWCNLKLMRYIEELTNDEVVYINGTSAQPVKAGCVVVRPDFRKSWYQSEQKRVNPESLYRRLYWIYQFKLIGGLIESSQPAVLVVNDDQEIDAITAFARRRRYFVPDRNASLARQLEILHQYPSPKKLIVAVATDLPAVVYSNYLGPLNIIWDSFLLNEKAQMMKDVLSKEVNIDENKHADDIGSHHTVDNIHKDTFSLISLHKAIVHHYLKMLVDANAGSKIFLCDPRLSDFNGIERTFGGSVVNIPLWLSEEEYNRDKEVAAEMFISPPEAEVNIDIAEAKEVLRHIFLASDDPDKPHAWHNYQIPCLDEIIPAQKDLLVSLPTGAGKSVLFQAPALFRSAYTSKLTLVISPLRALMHDQVSNLWDKGFYSNVEFLSGDRSYVEIRDINRRVAGGEITLLYITPERFRSRSFENCLLTRLDGDSGLEYVVFDEAHCISQWGQEFRPDYLNAGRKVAGYSKVYSLRKLLFSATISDQVFNEISVLMPGISPIQGTEKSYNPVRDHIRMGFKHNVNEDERLTEVADYLMKGQFNPNTSRAIVFVKSRKRSEECALLLPDKLKEIVGPKCTFTDKVAFFHAGMDAEDRKDIYDKFKEGEIVILFATKAFGMGMDIPNIHFVSHYSPPGTFEDFLQEVGRAGRDKNLLQQAGFNEEAKPINTICLTSTKDFGKLKDQLHESRISWHEVKEMKDVVEEYIQKFKPVVPDENIPVAVPFNLYSAKLVSTDEELDNKFRIGLHWLERLNRIKLGYFTITHLELDGSSLKGLDKYFDRCPNKDTEKVCRALLSAASNAQDGQNIQIAISSLREFTRLSLDNLFKTLLQAHSSGIIKLEQEVVIEPTNLRKDEILHYCSSATRGKYPALKLIFDFARRILNKVPLNESEVFDGELLDEILKESIDENLNISNLQWPVNPATKSSLKTPEHYVKDIRKKRSKHAFTIIRLLGKTRHETKMEKQLDHSRKAKVIQSIFNGYHKKHEWVDKLQRLESDCVRLLDETSTLYFKENKKSFNWPDLVSKLGFEKNVQHVSDVLFILSVLGYLKTGGLLPTGIEVYLQATEPINETDLQSDDKKVFDDFEEARKVRELKLLALEVLASFHKNINHSEQQIKNKQDNFIKRYFACNSMDSLLKLLQEELPPNDPMLTKWRGDAIRIEEDKLNPKQRIVYDANISQHINVMAGPGSGKTHTLTLRVARLIHHTGTSPDEILVLAYNRAVVSELKERLGKLFAALGYGNISKRIKIFTFHGLAKKYCQAEVEGRPFEEWEPILLNQLRSSPGNLMNQLGPLKHILVDEFQDINNTRVDLLDKLQTETNAFIFIIGDPNQSIYGYERTRDGGDMSPWPYYARFNNIFNPAHFTLFDNHRSYPHVLKLAGKILKLAPEHQHLIPIATRIPEPDFIKNYTEVIDRTQVQVDWWTRIPSLLQEKYGQPNRSYRQIAILFRTNNEAYRGFQKVKALNLPHVRIRIQGSSSSEFSRIRECHEVLSFLRDRSGRKIEDKFQGDLKSFIDQVGRNYPNWNQFYIKVMYSLVLEYLEESDEEQTIDALLAFIDELTFKDDGQLYKIYEKHRGIISPGLEETEIVLTTMHKVKGLEFDCVVVPPSFSNLPLGRHDQINAHLLAAQLEEERRLLFVAFTRARYRLLFFYHHREKALLNNETYQLPEEANGRIGIPVETDLKKLNIGWAAKPYNYKTGVNNYIKLEIKSGDLINVRRKVVPNNGKPFTVCEILKAGTTRVIGEVSSGSNISRGGQNLSGYIVNEVYVWTFEDTCQYDKMHDTSFADGWCDDAKVNGYIYLVDFAGYGNTF